MVDTSVKVIVPVFSVQMMDGAVKERLCVHCNINNEPYFSELTEDYVWQIVWAADIKLFRVIMKFGIQKCIRYSS